MWNGLCTKWAKRHEILRKLWRTWSLTKGLWYLPKIHRVTLMQIWELKLVRSTQTWEICDPKQNFSQWTATLVLRKHLQFRQWNHLCGFTTRYSSGDKWVDLTEKRGKSPPYIEDATTKLRQNTHSILKSFFPQKFKRIQVQSPTPIGLFGLVGREKSRERSEEKDDPEPEEIVPCMKKIAV